MDKAQESNSPHKTPKSAPRILVIEDDFSVAKVLRVRLESAGYSVHVEASGIAGLDYAMKHRPNLIILDLRLPDMNGYEVGRKLREMYSSWIAPILMLTAMDHQIDKVRGFERGADAYLTKPYDPDELLQTVETLLSGK